MDISISSRLLLTRGLKDYQRMKFIYIWKWWNEYETGCSFWTGFFFFALHIVSRQHSGRIRKHNFRVFFIELNKSKSQPLKKFNARVSQRFNGLEVFFKLFFFITNTRILVWEIWTLQPPPLNYDNYATIFIWSVSFFLITFIFFCQKKITFIFYLTL